MIKLIDSADKLDKALNAELKKVELSGYENRKIKSHI